jgi:predicted permease
MISDWLFRLRALLGKGRVETDLDEEVRFHVAQQVAAFIAAGVPAEEARRRALLAFGGVEQVKEECRDARGVGLVEQLWTDARYAGRTLVAQPAFALVVIVTLALGIGANTAIFQIIDAIQFRTVPVKDPERLVEIRPALDGRWGSRTGRRSTATYALWDGIRRNQQAMSGVFAWGAARFDLSVSGESRLVDGIWVSGGFFDVLGVPAALGRVFTPKDDERGCAQPGVVLSYAFWQREFAGARSVVGRTIHLDGHVFDVVGVTPRPFYGIEVGRSFDVAVPICAEPLIEPATNAVAKKYSWWLDVIGRLAPGWTVDRANAQLASISPAVFADAAAPAFPPQYATKFRAGRLRAEASPTGVSDLRGAYAQPLWLLLALAALVQGIACANLANLLLARASTRQREIAVRVALGASFGRVVRQLLTESLLLASIGTAVAAVAAPSASRFLVAYISSGSSPLYLDLAMDWRLLAFTGGLAFATCLLFGLAPAVRATRQGTADAVKAGRVVGDDRQRFTLRRLLVVVQVALSFVLVVGALLFVQTVRNLATMNGGFRTDNVLVADFDVRAAHIPPPRQPAFLRQLRDRLANVPGVESVADAAIEPCTGAGWNDQFIVDGVVQPGAPNENHVSPGFFRLLGTPLVAGRDFMESDLPGTTRVAVVNEAFAERLLRTRTPVGRTFQLVVAPADPSPTYQVVGVVGNTKYSDLRAPVGPIAYFPEAQDVDPNSREELAGVMVLVRGRVPVETLRASLTAAARDVTPAALVQYRALGDDIERGFLRERLMAALSGFFGGLAALLATLGLYGVVSYMLAKRRHEIGIRLALGAARRDVLAMVVRDASTLVAVGLAAGVGLSLAATRAAATLLFGVRPWDPATLAAAAAGLAVIAVGASALPAWRASRLDPNLALREE